MVLRVDEVWKVAKVGLKRMPGHPVFCSEVQEGRKGSERRLYPQMKEQWPSHEARKKLISPRVFGDQEKFKTSGEEVKRPVLMKQIG